MGCLQLPRVKFDGGWSWSWSGEVSGSKGSKQAGTFVALSTKYDSTELVRCLSEAIISNMTSSIRRQKPKQGCGWNRNLQHDHHEGVEGEWTFACI